jgi:hypothetical protein
LSENINLATNASEGRRLGISMHQAYSLAGYAYNVVQLGGVSTRSALHTHFRSYDRPREVSIAVSSGVDGGGIELGTLSPSSFYAH